MPSRQVRALFEYTVINLGWTTAFGMFGTAARTNYGMREELDLRMIPMATAITTGLALTNRLYFHSRYDSNNTGIAPAQTFLMTNIAALIHYATNPGRPNLFYNNFILGQLALGPLYYLWQKRYNQFKRRNLLANVGFRRDMILDLAAQTIFPVVLSMGSLNMNKTDFLPPEWSLRALRYSIGALILGPLFGFATYLPSQPFRLSRTDIYYYKVVMNLLIGLIFGPLLSAVLFGFEDERVKTLGTDLLVAGLLGFTLLVGVEMLFPQLIQYNDQVLDREMTRRKNLTFKTNNEAILRLIRQLPVVGCQGLLASELERYQRYLNEKGSQVEKSEFKEHHQSKCCITNEEVDSLDNAVTLVDRELSKNVIERSFHRPGFIDWIRLCTSQSKMVEDPHNRNTIKANNPKQSFVAGLGAQRLAYIGKVRGTLSHYGRLFEGGEAKEQNARVSTRSPEERSEAGKPIGFEAAGFPASINI